MLSIKLQGDIKSFLKGIGKKLLLSRFRPEKQHPSWYIHSRQYFKRRGVKSTFDLWRLGRDYLKEIEKAFQLEKSRAAGNIAESMEKEMRWKNISKKCVDKSLMRPGKGQM